MQDKSVKRLNELWLTPGHVEKLSIPEVFPKFSDPLNWALNLAKNDPYLISTAMRSAFKNGPDDGQMIYASRGDAPPEIKTALIDGVESGASVQLQVNGLIEKSPEVARYLKASFEKKLIELNPFGFQMLASLWITGPGHTYNAHCDFGDHCLMQLHGEKKVKFWGPSPGFDASPLYTYDFNKYPERFKGPSQEVLLKPGEMVFFSKGVMHEVSVPEQDTRSVSVAVAFDHVYPLLTLIDVLNKAHPNHEALKLKSEFTSWEKFGCYVFDPNRYLRYQNTSVMPEDLKLSVLMALENDPTGEIKQRLDQWWAGYSQGGQFTPTGSLPKAPLNRKELLKQKEANRINNSAL